MPILTSNIHPQEIAALGVALAEAAAFGADYARQVVRNAKALGRALRQRGFDVLYGDLGFTGSHTVLLRMGSPSTAVSLLDRAGIFCNARELPWDEAPTATGIRLGT